MNINIFILCFNESILLPRTINHYKKNLPNCIITIYDNESTDNSVEIAKSLGCKIISWSSQNIIDDYKYIDIKNNCWKNIENGWIIVLDMDEWLCVTENQLQDELSNGTTILNIYGVEMIGESTNIELSDIDLETITKYVDHPPESKKLCFLREKISDMNYSIGAHGSDPKGTVKYSSKLYINKHMSILGIPFITNKMKKRHERAKLMQSKGFASHYTDDYDKTKNYYNEMLNKSKNMSKLNELEIEKYEYASVYNYKPVYNYKYLFISISIIVTIIIIFLLIKNN